MRRGVSMLQKSKYHHSIALMFNLVILLRENLAA